MRSREMTTAKLAELLAEAAPKVGIRNEFVPRAKTLQDAINGRHWPSAPTMLLVRHVTGDEIDLEHWVRDLCG